MRRVPQKRDAIEPLIVEVLQRAGFSVAKWSAKDCPDLVVGRDGRTYLVEVKSGAKEKLRDGQARFHREWRGAPVFVVRSVDDAIRFSNSHIFGMLAGIEQRQE